MKIFREIFHCLYQAGVNTIDDDGIEHAGNMAFLCLLSLFPFLVFVVALAGLFGESNIGAKLVHLLLTNLPEKAAKALEPRIQEIISGPPQGMMTLAIVGAIWTASSSVEGLRTILNKAYRVVSPPPYVFRRFLSIIQFLLLSIIVSIVMLLLIIAPVLWEKIGLIAAYNKFPALAYLLEVSTPILYYMRYIILGFILLLVVATLYLVLPNVRLKSLYVLPGSILVVFLWFCGGLVLSLYIKHFQQLSLIYGGLGGVIVSLLFFYIINIIFIYGAEFNYLFGPIITEHLLKKNNLNLHKISTD
jgi:membrane protein